MGGWCDALTADVGGGALALCAALAALLAALLALGFVSRSADPLGGRAFPPRDGVWRVDDAESVLGLWHLARQPDGGIRPAVGGRYGRHPTGEAPLAASDNHLRQEGAIP